MADYIARGIDVSQAQGVIDWAAVKASGLVDFAIIRTGFGWRENSDSQVDKQFAANVKGCEENGIPYGFYHYSYCTNPYNARKEAKYMLNIIKGTQPTYPIWLDIEDKTQIEKLTTQQRTSIAHDFCDEVKEWGYLPGVYSYRNFLVNHLNMKGLASYETWIAQVNVAQPTYDGEYGMWQYSWKGSIPGIEGEVDLNYCYKNYPKIIKNLCDPKDYDESQDVDIIKNPDLVDRDNIEWVFNNDIRVVNDKRSGAVLSCSPNTVLTAEAVQRKMRDNHIEYMRSIGYVPKEELK